MKCLFMFLIVENAKKVNELVTNIIKNERGDGFGGFRKNV